MDWTDRAQAVGFLVEDARQLAGSAHPFDAAGARRLVERDCDRARNFASVTNHMMLAGGAARQGRLQVIQAPLLVVHGTEDPIFPIEHGVALSDLVEGATLVRLEGGGHELHQADWQEIIAAIVAHTGQ